MSQINIYTLNEQEVKSKAPSYSEMYQKTVEYCSIISKNHSASQMAATEIIYQECLKSFKHNEYVRSADEALDHISSPTSPFMQMLDSEINKDRVRRKKKERAIAAIKKKCAEKGLDVEKEIAKYEKKVQWAENVKDNLGLILIYSAIGVGVVAFFLQAVIDSPVLPGIVVACLGVLGVIYLRSLFSSD